MEAKKTPARADLIAAISSRDANAVREILSAAPKLASDRAGSGPSPLLWAAYHRQPEVVEALRAHASPDVFEASALGDEARLAEILRENPAQVAGWSGDGWTPLHLAAFFGHDSAVTLLLAHGAAVDAVSRGTEANRPLHAALSGARSLVVVRALIEAGADVTARCVNGITPLHTAASRGDQDCIRLLLERGADPRAAMDDGKLPGDLAADHGFAHVVATLLFV